MEEKLKWLLKSNLGTNSNIPFVTTREPILTFWNQFGCTDINSVLSYDAKVIEMYKV